MIGEFYVYAYYDRFSGLPFYVGKGKGDRAFHHIKEAKAHRYTDKNMHKRRKIQKHLKAGVDPEIRFLDSGLSEEQAFEFEEFLIAEIGRADRGAGPLTNLTDGGEGAIGIDRSGEKNSNYGKRGEKSIWWGRKHSNATRKKMSAVQAGRVITEEHRNNLRKPKSEQGRANIAKARIKSTYRPTTETKEKISVALKGRSSPMRGVKHTDEARQKMSESRKGVPKKKTPCVYCGAMCASNVLYRWHMNNCKENM